jgi:glyoxylase-like metal-dependent hydrolase (beta-lactamase superfamily II)
MPPPDRPPARSPRQEAQPADTEVTEVAPGVLRMQLPISMPGLGHVNCYALEDERGLAVVDPGMPGPATWRALTDRLQQVGAEPRHVHTIVITHSHPDHFGGAAKLRSVAGAEVVTHRSFRTWLDLDEEGDPDALDPDGPDADADAGRADPNLDAADVEARVSPIGGKLPWRDAEFVPGGRHRLRNPIVRRLMRRWMRSPKPTRRLEDAEVIRLARREWVAIHTPGHTLDHLCLLDPAEGLLLAGDHVLPTITPHVSGLGAGADPLANFLRSLGRIRDLDGVRLGLPAHGHPFDDVPGRVDAIRRHHQERLDAIHQATAASGRATVEAVTQQVFHPRAWGQMAESETYAHLEHLRRQGRVVVDDRGPDLVYEVAS